MNLGPLIQRAFGGYEALAIRLAQDTGAMGGLKRKLAQNRLTAPLFDTDLFRRNIEAAYTAMWRNWKKGDPPKSFAIDGSG